MAIITPVITNRVGEQDNYAWVFSWGPMHNGDVGIPIPANLVAYADRSFQVEGTFGAGGTATIEGSNNGGAQYHPMTTPQGVALQITTSSLVQVTEVADLMRPNVAGDGTTSITVTAMIRKALR